MITDIRMLFRILFAAAIVWALILLPFMVYAGDKHETPSTPNTSASEASSYANAGATSGSTSGANSGSESFSGSVNDFLSLGLPPVAGAARVYTQCHEAYGGKSGLGIGTGGRVTINAACQEIFRCVEYAKLYIRLGRPDMAIAELAKPSCGGIPEPEPTITTVECKARQERLEEFARQECEK